MRSLSPERRLQGRVFVTGLIVGEEGCAIASMWVDHRPGKRGVIEPIPRVERVMAASIRPWDGGIEQLDKITRWAEAWLREYGYYGSIASRTHVLIETPGDRRATDRHDLAFRGLVAGALYGHLNRLMLARVVTGGTWRADRTPGRLIRDTSENDGPGQLISMNTLHEDAAGAVALAWWAATGYIRASRGKGEFY